MDVNETQDSIQEVVSPHETIQQDTQPQESQEKTEVNQEDSEWIKNLRRDRKEALRRAEESERKFQMQSEMIERLMSQQSFNNANQGNQEPDILSEIAKEEYVPGEKVVKALVNQEAKFRKEIDEVKKSYASQHQNSLINDLRREYSDFDQVVNPETLSILEETNPRLAQAIARSGDPYMIAVQSYEYIKAKGLSSKATTSRRSEEMDRKIEQNKKTVQSPQVFDKRPMAQAFKMTEDLKKELQQEMQYYAQQAGMGY